MKTKTIVTEITKRELSDLFCIASEGSPFVGFLYKKSDYEGTELESEYDYKCDKCAKLLLAGKTIFFADYYAEDADEHYGELPHKYSGSRGCMKYKLTLEDIKNGVSRALDSDDSYIKECINDWITDDSCNLDLTEAENIMQYIVFGEIVYG